MHLSSRGLCLSLAFSLERCGENSRRSNLHSPPRRTFYSRSNSYRKHEEEGHLRSSDTLSSIALKSALRSLQHPPCLTLQNSNGPLCRRPLQIEFNRSLSQLEDQRDTRKGCQDTRHSTRNVFCEDSETEARV